MEPTDFHQNTQIERGYQAAISVSACLENIERWEKNDISLHFWKKFLNFYKAEIHVKEHLLTNMSGRFQVDMFKNV